MSDTLRRKLNGRRTERGAVLGLIALCALIAVMLIFAGFKLYAYLGGSQEFRNSVDAASLSVAQHAPELKVTPAGTAGSSSSYSWKDGPNDWHAQASASSNYLYSDVADSQGMIGLSNINRVWGKAFLINANAQEMVADNFDTRRVATANAVNAFQQAKNINSNLYQRLTDKSVFAPYFSRMATDKPAKLLGQQGGVTVGDKQECKTACMYPGEESNIIFNDTTMLPAHALALPVCANSGNTYVQGYNAFRANNNSFGMVTFHANEAPHLIATNTFNKAMKEFPSGMDDPIPNAFRQSGKTTGDIQFATTASAVANPMRSFQLAIPYSFVSITVSPAIVNVLVENQAVVLTSYAPGQGKTAIVQGYKYKFHDGILMGYCNLGNEYKSGSLLDALNSVPQNQAVYDLLTQRCKEFKQGFTKGQLISLLQSINLPHESLGKVQTHTYYIYPSYTTADHSDPNVKIGDQSSVPSWLAGSTGSYPEGTPKEIVTPTTKNTPNWAWSVVIGGPYPSDNCWANNTGTLTYTPGSGYTQNLCAVTLQRQTTIYFTGDKPQPGGAGPAGP